MPQKFIRFPFAVSGDRTAIPEATDVSGNVSYEQGYGPDYQRPKTDPLSKDIERDKMNALFYDLTENQRQYQLNGVPDWVPASDNGGAAVSYPAGARVRYTNGLIYVSAVSGNTGEPTVSTDWVREAGRLIGTHIFSTAGTYSYVPTPGMVFVEVEGVGGGGGGGGAPGLGASPPQIAPGGGGGSGAPMFARLTAAAVGAGQTVTVGVGGSGGISSGGIGGNGGTSSFGALVTAPGGIGGAGGQGTQGFILRSGGAGGAPGSGSAYSMRGAPGDNGIALDVSAGAYGAGGTGGASVYSGGGIGGGANQAGFAGAAGSGGGGGCTITGGTGRLGGNGGPGLVIIREYA